MATPEFSQLLTKAHELGLSYSGSDIDELRGLVTMAQAEKGKDHPVPCFGLSYDPTDRLCRVCQLRNPCADADGKPRVEMAEPPMNAVPCEVCGKGDLSVELLDLETRELKDYGCTHRGCPGSLSVQCGYENHGAEVVRELVFEPPPVEKKPVTVAPPSPVASPAPVAPPAPVDSPKKVKLRVVRPPGNVAPTPPPPAPPAPPVDAQKVVHVKVSPQTKASKAAKALKAKPSKAATKAKPSKAATKMPKVAKIKTAAVKAASEKTTGRSSSSLVFIFDGTPFTSLSKLVNTITGTRNWSPLKFFGVTPESAQAGQTLTKTWNGEQYIVEVIKQ